MHDRRVVCIYTACYHTHAYSINILILSLYNYYTAKASIIYAFCGVLYRFPPITPLHSLDFLGFCKQNGLRTQCVKCAESTNDRNKCFLFKHE